MNINLKKCRVSMENIGILVKKKKKEHFVHGWGPRGRQKVKL